MILTDTHTHLYEDSFHEDFSKMVDRAHHNRVRRFFIPNVDSETADSLVQLCENNEGFYGMMGLHPCSVKENYLEELKTLENYFKKYHFYAVGEIGLDLYWDKTYIKEQIHAFEIQLNWSLEKNLPIAVHCRDAFEPIFEVISKPEFKNVRGIFHCFTGNAEQAEKLVSLGFYLGIGGVVTYKNGGLDKALENIPLENLVLETDSPYLSPVPFRGKRNESGYLLYIAEKLAEIKEVPLAKLAEITTQNSKNIFGV